MFSYSYDLRAVSESAFGAAGIYTLSLRARSNDSGDWTVIVSSRIMSALRAVSERAGLTEVVINSVGLG